MMPAHAIQDQAEKLFDWTDGRRGSSAQFFQSKGIAKRDQLRILGASILIAKRVQAERNAARVMRFVPAGA